MKVKIGPYVDWIGPYQIAEMLMFWRNKDDDRVFKFGSRLAENKDGSPTRLMKVCEKIYSFKKRKVVIKLDKYDTWNVDSTLSYIIIPLLKQLQQTKHGSPFVDDEDVPEYLRSTAVPNKDDGDVDDNHHLRWKWVLDEMIWAFEQHHPDNDWEKMYQKGTHDVKFIPCSFDEKGEPTLFTCQKGSNDTYECDYEGMKRHEERIVRGTTLFGKYYRCLWD